MNNLMNWTSFYSRLLSEKESSRALFVASQYLALTCPQVALSVNKLSQFMHCPMDLHWFALKRLIRKLFTWHFSLRTLIIVTSFACVMGYNPIIWSSKWQKTLARTSVTWFANLLTNRKKWIIVSFRLFSNKLRIQKAN